MMQEMQTPQATATQYGEVTPDPSELSEAELAQVAGGDENDIKGDININPSRA